MKDYQHSMKLAKKLNNWDHAEEIVNEVISISGLQDSETEQQQKERGRKVAQKTGHPGKKI